MLLIALRSSAGLTIGPAKSGQVAISSTNGGSMKFLALMTRICCFLLIITGLALSQSFTAAVRGVVSDQTGAAVADAKVIITEAARNVQHSTTTDAQGRYYLSALPPGQYTMTVEAKGFKKYSQ